MVASKSERRRASGSSSGAEELGAEETEDDGSDDGAPTLPLALLEPTIEGPGDMGLSPAPRDGAALAGAGAGAGAVGCRGELSTGDVDAVTDAEADADAEADPDVGFDAGKGPAASKSARHCATSCADGACCHDSDKLSSPRPWAAGVAAPLPPAFMLVNGDEAPSACRRAMASGLSPGMSVNAPVGRNVYPLPGGAGVALPLVAAELDPSVGRRAVILIGPRAPGDRRERDGDPVRLADRLVDLDPGRDD